LSRSLEIGVWLRGLNLERYERAFRDNDVDLALLPELTADDLVALGVVSVGHRRRLLSAIAALKSGGIETIEPTAPSTSIPPRLPFHAERRQLTVMFCDFAGSTALSNRLDPEDYREVLQAYQGRVRDIMARFEGFIARYVGDGVLIYFGWPVAHETDAERAVRAALEVAATVGGMPAHGERLQVRLGIATGLVIVGEPIGSGDSRQQTAVGETPNLAARLQGVAGPNGVVISEETRRIVGDLFEYRDLGPLDLKGFAGRVRAFEVLRPGSVDSRFEALRSVRLSPLVGRDEELDILARRWRRAAGGEGQVVLVSGEPGIGKSRLTTIVRGSLSETPHLAVRYFCSPHYRDSALHPFIAQLTRAAGFESDDAVPIRLDKLDALLSQSSDIVAEARGSIADLLGLGGETRYPSPPSDPRQRREMTLSALLGLLHGLAVRRPLLVIFEDAQWADSTSLELLDRIVERAERLPVLVIITFRPDFVPPWVGNAHVSSLLLNRLNRSDTERLVAGVAGADLLPPALVHRIVDRTDGIPLFVEELTRNVIESGITLDGTEAGVAQAIPASLHDSLMARLDRLEAVKQIAQLASAIGREFSYELLRAAGEIPDGRLRSALDQLVETGLIRRRGDPPRARYTFRHALIQDAAYLSLLKARRHDFHRRIAEALRRWFPETDETQPELIAHHYTEAGLAAPAIDWWLRAGRKALARSAAVEAAAQLRQALALLPNLPDDPSRMRLELELQSMLGGALFVSRNWSDGEALQAYSRARELADHMAGADATIPALSGVFHFHIGQGQYRDAREVATAMQRIAAREDKTGVRDIADRCMGICLHWTGDTVGALACFDRVLERYDPARHRESGPFGGWDPVPVSAMHSCWDLLVLGYPERARERFQFAVAQRSEITDKHSLGFSLVFGGHFSLLTFDQENAHKQFTDAAALASEQGFAHWLGLADFGLGFIRTSNGDHGGGLAQTREGYERYCQITDRGSGSVVNRTYWLALMARVREAAGDPAGSLRELDTAIAVAERADEHWYEPELHRLKGKWLLRHAPDDDGEAEMRFLHAIERARQQSARMWELRASLGLARIYERRHELKKAREFLAPIHAWFGEGTDWPDIQRASEVLSRLCDHL
jgi:class 3 adenylate cyclase/tetratricopeptide (TPR) repeat protein